MHCLSRCFSCRSRCSLSMDRASTRAMTVSKRYMRSSMKVHLEQANSPLPSRVSSSPRAWDSSTCRLSLAVGWKIHRLWLPHSSRPQMRHESFILTSSIPQVYNDPGVKEYRICSNMNTSGSEWIHVTVKALCIWCGVKLLVTFGL